MESDLRPGHDRRGADHFWIAQRLTLGAWTVGIALQVCLFVRPTPSGVPYVGDWHRYFFRALLYEGLGNYLVALPFLIFWLLLFKRAIRSSAPGWVHLAHVSVLAFSLFVTQFDHEIMRFVGTRVTASYLQIYVNTQTSWPVVFNSLLLDRGGPLLPVLLWFGAPAGFAWWAVRHIGKEPGPARGFSRSKTVAVVFICLPILAPVYVREFQGGKGPTRRVEPVLFSIAGDLLSNSGEVTEPLEFTKLVARHQAEWLSEDTGAWTFTSPMYPYLRQPVAGAHEAPPAEPWNVVVFQLESFRSWNMGLMRPDLAHPPPTPFLDALGRSAEGAYWVRHSSFGPPTVNGFIAWNCSQLPHSGELALATFTYTELDCLPNTVRRHGYRTEVFTGFDPDWDNEALWFRRWYDRLNYYHDATGDDQVLVRHTAERLKELGRSPNPFLASVIFISNHYPFASVGTGQDVAGHATASERILNTMHYSDTAVRQLVDAVRGEPWFDHTLFVFVGDHGYNLGERHSTPGQFNLYRESTWVPLIVVGRHPRLKSGPHVEPASLLDVAPTIADLLGIRDPTPWQGHSLVAPSRPPSTVTFVRQGVTFGETADYSLVVDPDTELPRMFDAKGDVLQTHAIESQAAAEAAGKLLSEAEDQRRLNDYLIRSNRIMPAR